MKCEGRFKEFRRHLYGDVLDLVIGEKRNVLSINDFSEMWDLVGGDSKSIQFDPRDPYFKASPCYYGLADSVRKDPVDGPLSLVPLIESPALAFNNPEAVREYALAMGNNEKLSSKLSRFCEHQPHFAEQVLRRCPSDIRLPGGKNLANYNVSASFGIGTIVPGGVGGGGVRSDSPFLIGVSEQKNRGELNLAAVIGFWPQDNEMLVSQIQPYRNGRLPEGIPFGVSALSIAETVARTIGFDKVSVYSARAHPIFREYPENWGQLGKEFVMTFDNSAKKLGFNGGRCDSKHEKVLRSSGGK